MSRFLHRLILFSMLIFAATAWSQAGQWVSHVNDLPGGSFNLYDCGETTVVFTRDSTTRLLFFDINGGAWVEEDFDTTQTWHYVAAEGDLALAISDSFAVAYNGLTSSAHVLRYSGERLRDDLNSQSYRCGKALAYLVTDEFFYVFDSQLDAWQQTAITLSPNYSRCNSIAGDDWVAAVMEATWGNTSDGHAYSLQTHGFAQTDDAPPYGPVNGVLNHGFADINNVSSDYKFVGYSSVTNSFAGVSIPSSFSSLYYGCSSTHGKQLRTTFAGVCSDNSGPGYDHHMFGYDTRLGVWNHDVFNFDWAVLSFWNNLYKGGQYAVTVVEIRETGEIGFKVYSGIDGSITTHWPGLYQGSNTCVPGGSVFVAVEVGNTAWGLDLLTGESASVVLPADHSVGMRTEGENFALISCFDGVREDMDLLAYHGPSNAWITTTTWRNATLDDHSGAHCYARYTSGTDLEVTFFSGLLGAFSQTSFADIPNPGLWRSDHLGYVQTDGDEGCLYDAHRDQLHHRDLDYEADSIGQAVFVGTDPNTETGWGYSAVTGNWTSVDIVDTPRVGEAGHYVAWVADSYPSHKYQAFNGFHDCWVELDLIGNSQGQAVGDQTMVVFHMSTIWAFNPEAPLVGNTVQEQPDQLPDPHLPAVLALHPVHPNPFNPSTRVSFDLPRSEQIRLRVLDMRGRKVCTLTDEVWSAGRHHVFWNGTNDHGRSVPSGAYFLHLETESRVVTGRAMLLK